TRLIDLHFFLQPHVFVWARFALAAALILYLFRIWQALPIALFVNCAANGILNAQGAVQHARQIVSLVLLAQTVAYFHGVWAAHGWIVATIATAGLLLEIGSPLMLVNRAWAAVIGGALICFHLGLDYAMGLSFIFNQWLLIIFMINLPYWIVFAGRRLFDRRL